MYIYYIIQRVASMPFTFLAVTITHRDAALYNEKTLTHTQVHIVNMCAELPFVIPVFIYCKNRIYSLRIADTHFLYNVRYNVCYIGVIANASLCRPLKEKKRKIYSH